MPTQYKKETGLVSSIQLISYLLGTLLAVLMFSNDITTEELVQNKAAWHKSCYVKLAMRASQIQATVGSSIFNFRCEVPLMPVNR